MRTGSRGGALTLSRRTPILAGIVILAAVLLLYRAPLIWLGRAWLQNPQYSHGFLLLGTCAFLAWRALRIHGNVQGERPVTGGAAILSIGGPLAIYGMAFVLGSPPLMIATLPVLILGFFALLRSYRVARHLAVPLLMPLVAVPIPLYDVVTGSLQQVSASLAAATVQAVGVDAAAHGMAITSGGFLFSVEPLCSGMSGLTSLAALALVIGHVTCLPPVGRAVLFALTLPLALMLNVLRISGTVILAVRTSPETALGIFHGASGVILFIAGAAALLVVAQRFQGRPEVTPAA